MIDNVLAESEPFSVAFCAIISLNWLCSILRSQIRFPVSDFDFSMLGFLINEDINFMDFVIC